MQPQVERAADVGDGVELVDGAEVGRAEVGDDGEQPVRARLAERGAQGGARHPAPGVRRDEHDVDVHHVGRGVDRGVRLPVVANRHRPPAGSPWRSRAW